MFDTLRRTDCRVNSETYHESVFSDATNLISVHSQCCTQFAEDSSTLVFMFAI